MCGAENVRGPSGRTAADAGHSSEESGINRRIRPLRWGLCALDGKGGPRKRRPPCPRSRCHPDSVPPSPTRSSHVSVPPLPQQKTDADGKATQSAHPARFSPDDKFSKHRVMTKKRFGILPTQLKADPL